MVARADKGDRTSSGFDWRIEKWLDTKEIFDKVLESSYSVCNQQRGPYFIIFKLYPSRLQYSVSLIYWVVLLRKSTEPTSACSSPLGFGIDEVFQEVKLPPLYSYPWRRVCMIEVDTTCIDSEPVVLVCCLHLWGRIFDMTPPNVNTKGRATCDSQLLLPTNTVLFAVQRTGHNETKDRVGPS